MMERGALGDRYRLLFDTTPCYITVQGRDFHIQEFNRTFQDDFGSPGPETRCFEAYKQRTERCDVCPVAQVFEDGKEHQSEEVVLTRDGRTCFVLVRAAPILDEAGEIDAVMEVSTNITELKELQSRMASVGRLITSLAHTVKGIVMSLDGGMYVVKTGFDTKREEMVRKGWDIVERNIARVTSLVLDILHFAKERQPEWALIDIGKLVHEVTELFSEKLRKNDIELDLRIDKVEPVLAEEKGLHSLIVSLLENAVDACRWDTARESHRIAIRFHTNKTQSHALLEVIDDGIGMDEETRAKIFTPMFSTKRGGGTGLGLLVAQKVAREHGGSISVTSASGHGAAFTVRLPLADPTELGQNLPEAGEPLTAPQESEGEATT